MNDLSSKFGLYEMLRILIPGFYCSTMSIIIFENIGINYQILTTNNVMGSVLYLFISIILGLFIYSFDIPKNYFLKKSLPTAQIKSEYTHLKYEDINNSYFTYFYNSPQESKLRSDSFLGFFHFCINNFTVSILMVLLIVCVNHTVCSYLFLFNIGVVILSLITARLLFIYRIRHVFKRQLVEYYKSKEFLKMIEENELNIN